MRRTIGRLLVAALIAGAVACSVADLCSAEAAFPYRFHRGRPYFGDLEGGPIWFRLLNIAATDTNAVKSLVVTSDSAATVITFSAAESESLTSGSAYVGTYEVPVARCVSLTISCGDILHVKAGTATLYGTNIIGDAISENYTVDADIVQSLVGSKTFASIDSLSFPQMDSLGVKVSIGRAIKLGLPMTLPINSLLLTFENGSVPSNPGTVEIDNDEIEKNTVYGADTAWDGASDFDFLFWIPPYATVGGTSKWN